MISRHGRLASRSGDSVPARQTDYYIDVVLTVALLCLLDRLLCLLYSLFFDENQDIEPQSLKSFFYFEMPFWYLNVATLIYLFEW